MMNRQPTTYLTQPGPHDVLFGRAAPAILHEGNRRFRHLVSQYKASYINTSKRATKDTIAGLIKETIEGNGGKFVRKVDTLTEAQ